jgi:hypothetical protein
MLIPALWGAWTYSSELLYKKQLSTNGIQGEAVITKRYKEEYSEVTYYYIDYVLIVNDKEYPRNYVWVEEVLWNSVDVGSQLPVIYLPDTPNISRLKNDKLIKWSFNFFVLGSIGSVFVGTIFVFCILGFDLQTSFKLRHIG